VTPDPAVTSDLPVFPAGPGAATVAWFHCYAGIAGDMALGALIDAGADPDEVMGLLGRLGLPGWELRFESSLRGGVSCTRALVHGEGGVRTYDALVSLVTGAALPERVAQRSLAVFAALARTEAALHRRPLDQVHLHEVGGHDAVVDIVGTSAALEVLGVETVSASAVATGTGTVHTSHGWLPNPAPATVRLLEGVPTYGRDVPVELTTPTGAALLAALCTSFGPLPPMTVHSSGFGGGAAEIDGLPNCTQVVIGRGPAPAEIGPGQPALLLETNLDDVTGEQLGYAISTLLDAGAFDAWVSPVTMKKGRPGNVLHVLADPVHADLLRREVHRATGTLGARATTVERWPRARGFDEVIVDGVRVRMKVAGDRAKPEFEDVARVAAETGAPLHEVTRQAEEAWRAGRPNPRRTT
jgi:pyridinium-3,5-bisthiocarboxylic acid mononucleotide nickel chelatase